MAADRPAVSRPRDPPYRGGSTRSPISIDRGEDGALRADGVPIAGSRQELEGGRAAARLSPGIAERETTICRSRLLVDTRACDGAWRLVRRDLALRTVPFRRW